MRRGLQSPTVTVLGGQVVATTTGTGDAAVTMDWEYDLRGRRVKETDPSRELLSNLVYGRMAP